MPRELNAVICLWSENANCSCRRVCHLVWDFLHCRCPRLNWEPGLPPVLTERRGPPTTRTPQISLASLLWDGMNHSAPCRLGCSLVPFQERLPWAAGEKEEMRCKGILRGGIWRGAFIPCCSHPGDPIRRQVRICSIFHETSVKLRKQKQL